MASRSELVLRACAVNVDHTATKYGNDSVLEQAVLYAEKHVTATSSATQTLPTDLAIGRQAGDANL
jgi:hypothetical protein